MKLEMCSSIKNYVASPSWDIPQTTSTERHMGLADSFELFFQVENLTVNSR